MLCRNWGCIVSTGDTILVASVIWHHFPLQADPTVQVDRNPKCCFFSFSPKIQPNRIVKAQLWVHLRPADEETTVFLQISRLKPLADGSRHIRIRSLKVDVSAGISSWQSIDVRQLLQVWLRQPETNWGIEINAYDANGNDLAVTSAESGEEGLVSDSLVFNSPNRLISANMFEIPLHYTPLLESLTEWVTVTYVFA